MLQRIQSLFLLLSTLGMLIFLATNTWANQLSLDESYTLNPYYLLHTKGGVIVEKKALYYIALMAILGAATSIIAIFQYRNRIRQMSLVAMNSLLIAACLATSIYHVRYDAQQGGHFSIGFWSVFVALIANWIANRFIRRDEQRVRDSNRMR